MKRKKTLADFWAVIFLVAAGLMFYFARLEPQADIAWWYQAIAWATIAAFFATIGWSKWKLKEFSAISPEGDSYSHFHK
jgi:CDP-diglyceride synthetase